MVTTPELSSPLVIENGVTHRLPQFVNIVSRLVGEKDISPNVRAEVGRAISEKLPHVVQDVGEVVGLSGNVKLRTNDERTMYRMGGVAATTLKDLIPQVSVALANGETTMTIDDLLLINLGTGEHHGGRAWMAAETHAVYEAIKAITYQEVVSEGEEKVEGYEKYAEISRSMSEEEGVGSLEGALRWASPYRLKSHEMAMEKMDEWFTKKTVNMGLGQRLGWRAFFSLWKLVEARGVGKLMQAINENVFDRNGDVKPDVADNLESYAKTHEMLKKLEPVLRESPISELK